MDLTGLIAVIGAFGIGPAIVYLRGRHKLEERRLELEARTGGGGGGGQETKRLTEENKLLRERVENLESIVCSVDFELNQKLAKVIDEQRSIVPPPAGPLVAGDDGPIETWPLTATSIRGGSGTSYRAGDLVTVAYDPARPIGARIVSFIDLWLPAVVAWGVVVLFGGCVWLSRRLRLRSRQPA